MSSMWSGSEGALHTNGRARATPYTAGGARPAIALAPVRRRSPTVAIIMPRDRGGRVIDLLFHTLRKKFRKILWVYADPRARALKAGGYVHAKYAYTVLSAGRKIVLPTKCDSLRS